ncbi:MAG: hypothetical protein IIA45_14895, partial [Bacteroidetes bacterium]|nr:hypothetical protein [Bacteroidota bacterium]
MNKKLFILFLIAVVGLTSLTFEPKFSYKVYGNVANYFENKNDLLTFFDFHKGDIVAEVGVYEGKNVCGFSLLTDSITFYVQDIDTIHLTQTHFDKIIKRCKRYKKQLTNKFILCFGTITQTNLPDNT